jgi:hypothetical protein
VTGITLACRQQRTRHPIGIHHEKEPAGAKATRAWHMGIERRYVQRVR